MASDCSSCGRSLVELPFSLRMKAMNSSWHHRGSGSGRGKASDNFQVFSLGEILADSLTRVRAETWIRVRRNTAGRVSNPRQISELE